MAHTLEQFTNKLINRGLMSTGYLSAFTASLFAQPTEEESLPWKLVEVKKLIICKAAELWKASAKQLVLGDLIRREDRFQLPPIFPKYRLRQIEQ